MALATAPEPTTDDRPPRASLRVVRSPGADRVPLRLSVRRVSVLSAARTAMVLAVLVAGALVATGLAVWSVARRMGFVDGIESTVASGLGMESWTAPASALFLVWVGLAATFALVAVLVVVLLTIAFNGLGRTVGGIDVVARAEPLERRA